MTEALATDPASMIASIDRSIATIVAGLLSETSAHDKHGKMLELDQLRRLRREYVMILNQSAPPLLADLSTYGPGGPRTTNSQSYGPTQ
jgi:hypothetical protein